MQRLMTRRVGADLPKISYKIRRDRTIWGSFHEFHQKFLAAISSSMAESVATPGLTKNDSKRDSNANIEKSTKITLREIDFRSLAELKEAFHLFDVNRDGLIDKDDLKYTFTSLGRPEVTDKELENMLGEMSNNVDFDAFVNCFGYKAIELDPEATLLDALSNWDYEGNGMISEERIRRDLQKWGDRFTEREVDRALEEAPLYKKDGVVMIDYVKFCAKVCGLRNVATCRRIEKEGEVYEEDIKSLKT